jgi:hypothetical protein
LESYLELIMKTPQRKFVVEFKSPRRRTKAQTNSIWDDTDLKALTREVEDLHPNLALPGHEPDTVIAGAVTLPEAFEAADEADAAADVVQTTSTATGILATDGLPDADTEHPEAASLAAVQENVRSTKPRLKSQGPAKRRVERSQRSKRASDYQSAKTTPVAGSVSSDELAALEVENKRLKQLLAEHLRFQNVQLTQMLSRFGPN